MGFNLLRPRWYAVAEYNHTHACNMGIDLHRWYDAHCVWTRKHTK